MTKQEKLMLLSKEQLIDIILLHNGYNRKITPISTLFIVAKTMLAIERATGIPYKEFSMGGNNTNYVYCRYIYCYLCKENGIKESIIHRFINRDRSTVYNAIKKAKEEFESNKDFINLYKLVVNELSKLTR